MSRRLAPEQRREQLLEASIRVFSRLGYGGARIEDLATEAGVANSLFSQHWPTKEAIFLEARARVRDENLQIARDAIARRSPVSSTDHLVAVITEIVRWYGSNPERIGVILDEPELAGGPVDVDDADLVADLVFRAVDPTLDPYRRIANLSILWAVRAAVDQMHRLQLDPGVVAVTMVLGIVGALDGVARQLGGRLDGSDDLLDHVDRVRRELDDQREPGEPVTADDVAVELSRREWPKCRLPVEPAPWTS